MIFHPNRHFRKHELHNGTLWLAGWIDTAKGKLNYQFADHIIPDIRGQFGLVWSGNDGWWLAMTDHLCTYPLWYAEKEDVVFSLWEQATAYDDNKDEVFYAMRDLLHGQMTVGTRTGRQEVKRLQPDHALDRGTQVRYRHSLDVQSDGPPMSEWGDRLYTAVKRNCADGDTLFLSGGRDSTTIANVAHHQGIKLRYVHVTRGEPNPDTDCTAAFADKLGIEVDYVNPWEHGIDYNEGDFWHDSSYAPKRRTLKTLKHRSGISGELGASESGSKKINTILQLPDITIEQLTNIWITTLEARNENVASRYIHNDYTYEHEEYRFWRQAYEELIQYFENMYTEIRTRTEDTHQLLKAVIMMHCQDHEVYRLHNYSQDPELVWKHPFTDPDWYDIIWNAPIELRRVHYHNREVYRTAARQWPWFDETAWQYGGPRGLTQ